VVDWLIDCKAFDNRSKWYAFIQDQTDELKLYYTAFAAGHPYANKEGIPIKKYKCEWLHCIF